MRQTTTAKFKGAKNLIREMDLTSIAEDELPPVHGEASLFPAEFTKTDNHEIVGVRRTRYVITDILTV